MRCRIVPELLDESTQAPKDRSLTQFCKATHMTTYTFIAKASTFSVNWNDPTVWAGGIVPNAADADVTIPTITTGSGSIFDSLLNIAGNESFSTRSISLTNNTIWVNGSLAAAGGVAINTGGDLRVLNGGVLSVGSLENNGFVGGSGQIHVSGMLVNDTSLSGFNGLTITAAGLTNTGILGASSGDMTLTVTSGGFTSLSGSTLTGGTYQTGSPFGVFNGTIHLNVGGVIAANAADILLYGGDIFSFDSASSTYIPLQSSLQSILPSGTLTLAGRTFNWGNLSVGGDLVLSTLQNAPNATLNSSSLIVDVNGHISGVGTIHAPITNNGTITSDALKIDGAVTGSGTLEIADGSTLKLTEAVSQTVMFLGDSGLLTLDNPASFAGNIAAAAAGDQINLAGVSLSSVTEYHYSDTDSGGVLTIHLTSGDIQLNFSGHFSTQSFTLSAGDQPLSSSPPSLVITEQGFIAPPSDNNTIPQEINNNGDIVGTYVDQNGTRHGFLKSSGTYVEVPVIGLPFRSKFNGINDTGDIVGSVPTTPDTIGFFSREVLSAFIYHNGAFSLYDYHDPTRSGDETHFEAINNAGTVVGYYTNSIVEDFNPHTVDVQHFTGFVFQNGTYQVIGPVDTIPHGLNDAVQVVGQSGSHGFLYNNGNFSLLDDPHGSSTVAYDINNAGVIVGYYYDSASGTHGFAYNTHTGTWAPIDAPGATATYINGINDLDQIVGYYVDHSGETHSFVSTVPPPFPSNAGNVDEWILSNGKWLASAQPGSHPAGFGVAAVADFTGDGFSDILWQNVNTGTVDLWKMKHGAWAGSVEFGTHPGSGWQIAGPGDFNGDGTNDVFWFNPATGQTDIWQLASGQWAASVSPGNHPTGYQVAGIGDFNHDGTSDVLWFNPTTRHVDEWNIVNGQWAGSNDIGTYPGAGYQIAGVGDFNNDGTGDMFWYNPSTGATDIWLLQNGKWSASVSPGNHPIGWEVAGIGDFNGDGTSDVLFYNLTTGNVDEWQITNGHWLASVNLGTHPGSAQIAGIGDFNGGGTSDVLWHQFL
ncbi:MAG: FG-GAP-like repeat-containing protein [Xanthobacteraceae bacterium]